MSALDDLLNDLDKPLQARPRTPGAGAGASSGTGAIDDLDALMAEMSAPVGKPSPAPAAKKPAPAASSDLDSLLNDLGGAPKPAAAKTPAAAKKVAAIDDLDALMADLGSPVAKPAAAKQVAAKPSPAPAPAKAPAAKPADDLDDLMAGLGAAPAAAKKTAAPAPKKTAAPPADDLDALMAGLGAPPAKATAAPKKSAAATDDLDELMAGLSAAPKKSAAPAPAPAAAPKKHAAAPANNRSDDLDALMADLGGGGAPARPTFQAGVSSQPQNVGPARGTAAKARTDELDSLMESLGGPPTGGAVVHSSQAPAARGGAKKDDLDDLMSSLSGPATGSVSSHNTSSPAMAPGGSRAPAGSVSRFDDLMSTVKADMNDLNTHGGRSRGTCYHCRQAIYDECMQALGRTYHPEHFMCGSCNNPLGTGSFFELAGQAHCQRCYQLQFCPKCAHCNQAITDKCVTALDKKWHVNCFVCTQCTAPFSGNFFERDGRPYCGNCFHSVFAPRCRSCNQPVLGDCVNALGAQWHPEHFNCQYCRRAFTGTFFEYEGLPYCEAHYYEKMGSSCAGCQQAISGACVDALGKKWHPEHFVCAFCMNKLEGSSYSEKNSKAYCRPCFGKLFGS